VAANLSAEACIIGLLLLLLLLLLPIVLMWSGCC
jgi:hypothetical protein